MAGIWIAPLLWYGVSIVCLVHSQHTCLYWKVYILSENNNTVSLNEVNCSSVILKSRSKKWDRIASETHFCSHGLWIYLHWLKCRHLSGVISQRCAHCLSLNQFSLSLVYLYVLPVAQRVSTDVSVSPFPFPTILCVCLVALQLCTYKRWVAVTNSE